MMRRTLILLVVCLVLPRLASAQTPPTVVNPTMLDFVVSPDHNAVDQLTGVAIVASYDYAAVASNPLGAIAVTIGLGKPVAADLATVSLPLPGLAMMTVSAIYTATITAKGPGGVSGPSLPSNPFAVAGPVKVPAKASGVKVR